MIKGFKVGHFTNDQLGTGTTVVLCEDGAVGGVKCEKYYVEMAIAWLISEIMIKNTQNAIEIMQKIIKNMQLNKFIINKSIQKACESYRIEQKIKYKLKEMKIK